MARNKKRSWPMKILNTFLIQRCLLSEEEIRHEINSHYLKTPTFASSTGRLGELGGLSSIQFQSFQLHCEFVFKLRMLCKYC